MSLCGAYLYVCDEIEELQNYICDQIKDIKKDGACNKVQDTGNY